MLTTHRQAGFNVIELMVVLFVASILMSVGLPSFGTFLANNRMATSANDVGVALHGARTEAIKQRADVTVCASTNWNTANPSCSNTAAMSLGWIIFRDGPLNNPNLTVDGGDEILYAHGPMNGDVTLTVADTANVIGGRQFLNFASTGFPRAVVGGNNTIFNFQLCDHRGDHDTGGGIAAGRWIQLTPTGRPQIHRAQDEVQAGANPAGGC
ncbi:MAG: hypothetical protein CL799_09075 [Chromatiales bacterium]|jgi:type IV fimbrial biogenesis protein FimT|nr:hypothetical protein [Chromatiales bacterium]MDP6151487.1 GspH/FimT family pseudopilin [Gammaproteobacteria bacterium]MDP7094020.1 GspH/FimT family pseudopilin [Gammaproteobacteria bacterium]MDP7270826.1 GspH/FimT family pseudopilin [Gammaproteobacteria bacterium]HJP04875.1 GspH/FimT family pseudopilin [Gammaproteobacteria bacterium]